ncbi:MAG: D-2-hydroxyacid dehydrogenase [Lachnospiraceae bacterium]|jgi:glycerate dehydrogenase|nr:D-2-hydroxyacid dehydrogenase [Lachnospiraceae bacterium]MCR5320434.1 D-2-hydroxyacid dehydrogenase [Lachnospiraceae bacterium]
MKIVILERNSVGTDISVDCFRDFGEVEIYGNTVTVEETRERIKDADVVIGNKAPLNESTLAGSKVKLISDFSTGYDNIDTAYCKENGICVCNIQNYCTAAVAQHTIALTMYLLEHLPHYDRYVKDGTYASQDRFSNFDLRFTELEGKTWGIVGMGHIGRKVAQIVEAMGCKVVFYSASGNSSVTEYTRVDFDTLLKDCDFISIHCPLSDRTRNLFDAEAFSKMKNSAILINVARGPIIHTQALYDALTNGEIAAAGLDVLEHEPISKDNPLGQIQDSNKLIITPHLAWASVEARQRCVDQVYENIQNFLKGSPSRRIV